MLNNVTLMGRLAHTPDVREKNEKKVAFLRLAVNRDIKGQDGVDADFFDITAFGKTAEFAEKYFQKGRQIAVIGRLQNRQYTDKDGNKRMQTTSTSQTPSRPRKSRSSPSRRGKSRRPRRNTVATSKRASRSPSNPLRSRMKTFPSDHGEGVHLHLPRLLGHLRQMH